MISCSLGKIDGAFRRKAYSGYTFVELTVPLDTYTDVPKFTLTLDNITEEYKVVGSEVHMRAGDKTLMKISAIRSNQEKWLSVSPMSIDSAEISEILKGMGISNGPSIPVTLVNLFLSYGQLAITLANMSPKTAFIDFDQNKVVYYSELYKAKPTQITTVFRRIYGRTPLAGFLGWENLVSGSYPDDAQSILPFGQFTNIDQTTMENLVNNCNNIAKLFSDMQIFTHSHEIDLGTTVQSPLTYDKKVVVAVEEQWDVQTCVSTVYCV